MAERDELAQDVIDGSKRMHVNTSHGLQEAIADHLRQLGYRRPRVIETADELDKLPVDAILKDRHHFAWTSLGNGRFIGPDEVTVSSAELLEHGGPVIVLWEGGE